MRGQGSAAKRVRAGSAVAAAEPVTRPVGARENDERLQQAFATIARLEQQISETIALTQKKVYQLEVLASFSAILNSTLDTQTVRYEAMEATCQLMNCETGSLFLVDKKRSELYWETALGPSGAELKESFRLPIDDRSIAGYVAMTGKAMLVNDVAHSKYHFKKADEKTHFRTRNMVCVPVTAKGSVIGVLQAINKVNASFEEEDLKLLENLSHQVAIAVENAQLYTRLKETFVQTAAAMAEAIEAKDRYTGGHTKRVVHYSLAIAEYLDLAPQERENLRLSATLHDIGKIGVDDSILKKQYALNDDEYEAMKHHPTIGYDILSHVDGLSEILNGMRYHHERPDGRGYPCGLKRAEIPRIAAIISVADTYDAMVSTRPYRKGLDPKVAFDEIVKNRGTQFEATVVDAFVKAFESGRIRKNTLAK